MAIEQIPNKLILRPLTIFEQAGQVDFREREARIESNVRDSAKTFANDVMAIEQNIVNQVKRHKIISGGKINNLKKITVNDIKLKAHLLNAFGFTYFKGKKDARMEVEASLGHRVPIRGFTNFQDITSLAPTEALEEFGKRQLVSKAEFTRMLARERVRSFTVAGIVEKDLLNSTRLLISKAIDQGWSIEDFQRGLREANVKYTGTAFGTAAKAGEPIKPFHAETILRTNFTTIYNRGRWALMNDPDVVQFVPAYQYSAILDSRTRETHAFMDGRIYLRDDPIWNDWLPANGFQCLLPGTMISNKRNSDRTIPQQIEDVQKGDLVYTHLGNWKPVIGLHKNWYEGQIIAIKLENGKQLRCTPNHKIFCKEGWKRADEIQLDDKVITRHSVAVSKQWIDNPDRRKSQSEWARENLAHHKGQIIKPEAQRSHDCPICGTWVYATAGNYHEYCSMKCASEAGCYSRYGEDNHAWKGGISKKPYGDDFTDRLKKEIRKRDGNICQICSTYEGVKAVHHIDGNKMNSKPENLITVCWTCHGKLYWQEDKNVTRNLAKIAKENELQGLLPGVGICANPGIKYEEYAGYVYNLSVEDDESYTANGIIVHNCRCMVIPVTSNIPFVVSRPTKVEPDTGFSGSVVIKPAA